MMGKIFARVYGVGSLIFVIVMLVIVKYDAKMITMEKLKWLVPVVLISSLIVSFFVCKALGIINASADEFDSSYLHETKESKNKKLKLKLAVWFIILLLLGLFLYKFRMLLGLDAGY